MEDEMLQNVTERHAVDIVCLYALDSYYIKIKDEQRLEDIRKAMTNLEASCPLPEKLYPIMITALNYYKKFCDKCFYFEIEKAKEKYGKKKIH